MSIVHDHRNRPWNVHRLAADFTLIDAWRFDLGAPGTGDFADFLTTFWGVLGELERGTLSRIRLWVGSKLGWDDGTVLPIPGCSETTVAARMSDRPPTVPSRLPSAGAVTIYELGEEALYEISNKTIHALLHLSWVVSSDGRRSAVLAVYVKYRGPASRLYMAAIWPARHFILYPTAVRRIESRWRERTVHVAA
jgi:hypothetical protein